MKNGAAQGNLRPEERIIVALDVPTKEDALRIVRELDGVITFYKIGLELLMAGGMEDLLRHLVRDRKVFVDLKLPGDIPETVKRVVGLATEIGVKFLTLSNSVTPGVIKSARDGRGDSKTPELLYVSYLSSLDRNDFAEQFGADPSTFERHLEQRTAAAKDAGVDGFIVSGQEIGLLRSKYPDVTLVSPGIRPSGSPLDDHKRSCTPAEAIRLGANYIVVGRPIRNAPNRKDAAQRIIDEIAGIDDGSSSAKAATRGDLRGYPVTTDSAPAAMFARSKD
jgi:orotidine-5'-phosphate decarboxylase